MIWKKIIPFYQINSLMEWVTLYCLYGEGWTVSFLPETATSHWWFFSSIGVECEWFPTPFYRVNDSPPSSTFLEGSNFSIFIKIQLKLKFPFISSEYGTIRKGAPLEETIRKGATCIYIYTHTNTHLIESMFTKEFYSLTVLDLGNILGFSWPKYV